jgi:hypothetical protein
VHKIICTRLTMCARRAGSRARTKTLLQKTQALWHNPQVRERNKAIHAFYGTKLELIKTHTTLSMILPFSVQTLLHKTKFQATRLSPTFLPSLQSHTSSLRTRHEFSLTLREIACEPVASPEGVTSCAMLGACDFGDATYPPQMDLEAPCLKSTSSLASLL